MFKCSNAQILKCSSVQMFKCWKFQMFKCQMSNDNKVKLLLERTSGVPHFFCIRPNQQVKSSAGVWGVRWGIWKACPLQHNNMPRSSPFFRVFLTIFSQYLLSPIFLGFFPPQKYYLFILPPSLFARARWVYTWHPWSWMEWWWGTALQFCKSALD